ncbi:MAG: hypothetical protein U7127_29610 [Phormidium sp.]
MKIFKHLGTISLLVLSANNHPQSPIVEATAWKTNQFGQIELIGNSTEAIAGTWNQQTGCNTP